MYPGKLARCLGTADIAESICRQWRAGFRWGSVVDAEGGMTRGEWIAAASKVPMTVERGRDLAVIAAADSAAVRGRVAKGVPVPAALPKAVAALVTMRDGLIALAKQRPGSRLADKTRERLKYYGERVYHHTEIYRTRKPLGKGQSFARYAAEKAGGAISGELMAVALGFFILNRLEK